jgi:hypothetical protein
MFNACSYARQFDGASQRPSRMQTLINFPVTDVVRVAVSGVTSKIREQPAFIKTAPR